MNQPREVKTFLLYHTQCTLGVSPNFMITVACGLNFHWYMMTLSLKFQKAMTKIEVFQSALFILGPSTLQPKQGRAETGILYLLNALEL
jgi:hypothetical protein